MYYDEPTAERAVKAARKIIEWVRLRLKNLGIEL